MKIELISDFNLDLLARFLSKNKNFQKIDVSARPFGNLYQSIQTPKSDLNYAFIWASAEGVSSNFRELANGEAKEIDQIIEELLFFSNQIIQFARSYEAVFVANLFSLKSSRGFGIMDWKNNGLSFCLSKMNLEMAQLLNKKSNIYIFDTQSWLQSGDGLKPKRSLKHWFLMKSPFNERFYKYVSDEIVAAIKSINGLSKKLIVLDLDNTIWGGVIGDLGWQSIRIGGHDHIGEAFKEFQIALKALTKRGIQLSLVSKNDEETALEAFMKNKEMILSLEDLSGWMINWNDKAQNIISLVNKLNLSLDSVVFIDDNPLERARVKESLPEVFVPEWSIDPLNYANDLRALNCFDLAQFTEEDQMRTSMYASDRKRKNSLNEFKSLDEWLFSADIEVDISELNDSNKNRIVQLFNKTNQHNLITRRITLTKLEEWIEGENSRELKAINLKDRYGNLGLVGIISWEIRRENLEIIDFLLSCRAVGRGVEKLMLFLAYEKAKISHCKNFCAKAIPTKKNKPLINYLKNCSLLEEKNKNLFNWDLSIDYKKPEFIKILNK